MHRIFSPKGFSIVMRSGDSRRFGIDLENQRDKIVAAAVETSETSDGLPEFDKILIKGRSCHLTSDYSHSLILRALARNVSRRLNIRPKNRDAIVREVIETLSDGSNMYIIRRDIKSFFESLPCKDARSAILGNSFIPSRAKIFLRSFFEKFCKDDLGVPRGIGLSSVIAELAMRSTDQKIRNTPGVYKYFRYADDMLIFCFSDPVPIC